MEVFRRQHQAVKCAGNENDEENLAEDNAAGDEDSEYELATERKEPMAMVTLAKCGRSDVDQARRFFRTATQTSEGTHGETVQTQTPTSMRWMWPIWTLERRQTVLLGGFHGGLRRISRDYGA